jgi:type IV secretory pathway VirB4 component
MISKQHDNHVLLTDERDDLQGFASYLTGIWEQFTGVNVIIDLTKYNEATLEDFLAFLLLSNKHRATKQSFIMINDSASMDHVPEELMIVPTYQEALDVLEMEEIERDLGF